MMNLDDSKKDHLIMFSQIKFHNVLTPIVIGTFLLTSTLTPGENISSFIYFDFLTQWGR